MDAGKLEAYYAAQQDLQRQLEVAEAEYEQAATIRLERKHKVDELDHQLRKLIKDGAYGKEEKPDPQMRLFDDSADLDEQDDDDDDDEEGLIDDLKVPAKIKVTLKKNGVETMLDLEKIIDGQNKTFPNGLEDMKDLNVDARSRVMAAWNDHIDDPEAELDQAVYSPPLPDAAPSLPATKGKVWIILKIDMPNLGIKAGSRQSATPSPTGEMLIELGETDDDIGLLQVGEYTLA